MKHLRSNIPTRDAPDLSRPAHVEFREDYFRGKNSKRAVIFLLSNGCEWALKSAHGCTMCGHIAKQTRSDQPISSKDFVTQFETAFSTIDFEEIPILNVFNNGSFFNDAELPSDARRAILHTIGRNKAIKKLLVESRPEFINESIIHETESLIPKKELEIAIGLETANDLHRIISINKGFSLRQFTHAANIISNNNVKLRSYILLKPPFLSEKEAIDDAVSSIKTAFSVNTNTVSLEAVTLQKYTLVEYLYNNSLYQLPWLWSIIEVVKRTSHLGRVTIGLFKFYPSPDFVPSNCKLCNNKVMSAIIKYNQTFRSEIFDQLHCQCKDDWKKVLNNDDYFHQNLQNFVLAAQKEMDKCSTELPLG
jgi:radical SAM enzyme (TIGR01210 family)